MQCYVYRSEKRDDTYVYLRERDAFGLVPANIAKTLGALSFVLEVALTPERKLARDDAGDGARHAAGALARSARRLRPRT